MNLFSKSPFFILFWGMTVDLLIANGFLLPMQRELWVTGGLQIIGAIGSVGLVAIYLHHALDKHKKETVNVNVKTNEPARVQEDVEVTNLQPQVSIRDVLRS